MVVTLPDSEELRGVRSAASAVAHAIDAMARRLEPGVTTRALDDVGRAALESLGAISAPEAVYGFPGATCISVNDEAAHGIPGDRVVQDGDLVNLDVSASLAGYYADSGASFPVGAVSGSAARLLAATRTALDLALDEVRPGALLNRVGRAVQKVAAAEGFVVVRNLCGHGVGRSLHEDPRAVLNYYEPSDRRRFVLGQVLTIEPFLSYDSDRAIEGEDGWTLSTAAGGLAAQFEHTIVVTGDGPLILTERST
jgi:methionyl aminopeptidase